MIRLGIWLVLFLFSPLVNAEKKAAPKASAKDAKEESLSSETRLALKAVSERYRKLKSWTAEFSQESFSVGLGRGTFQNGNFRFKDPNMIDFFLKEPDASRFLSDGEQAWHIKYPKGLDKPAEGQHFPKLSNIELSRYLIFLKGIDVSDAKKEKELLANYKVSAKVDPAAIVLSLEPKQSSEIAAVQLHFGQNSIPPSKIVLEDALGNTTTVTILKTDINAKLERQSFKPELKRGSKITEKSL